nr:mechanosensitive ion channel [Gemmatimonadota bacterium]
MPSTLAPLQASTTDVGRRPRTLAEWRRNGVDYAVDKAIDVGGVLLSMLALWYFIRFLSRRIEHWSSDGSDHLVTAREQRARTAAKLVRSLGRAIITVVAVLMVLNQLDFNISPLLASAGVVGLAISFGSQSLVRDYVTGFFLQLEHQFALGDVIRVGAVQGTVENITLRLVYLRDANGALH